MPRRRTQGHGHPAGRSFGSGARREFGSSARTADDAHDAWRIRWIDDLISDISYSARALRRDPGFALAAVFCLALGIGANTTIFNITTSFLFSLPSGRDASSLISIWEGGNSAAFLSDYKFLRDARIFDGVAGINAEIQVNWRESDRTSRLFAGQVTDDYFTTLAFPACWEGASRRAKTIRPYCPTASGTAGSLTTLPSLAAA